MRKAFFLAALSATMCVGSAQAATVFTDAAAFRAAVSGTSHMFPASQAGTYKTSYSQDGVTFSQIYGMYFASNNVYNGAIYTISRYNVIAISSTFTAFGLYIGSADGTSDFSYNANGTTGIFTTPSSAPSTNFIGFTDTAPINVTFNLANGREFDITSFVTGAAPVVTPPVTGAVPEPATWAMMILGMGAVGYALRRRQKVTTQVSYAA